MSEGVSEESVGISTQQEEEEQESKPIWREKINVQNCANRAMLIKSTKAILSSLRFIIISAY